MMRDYRNFFSSKSKDSGSAVARKHAEAPIRVAFFSDLFAHVSKNFIATNSEYANLKNEIMDSIEPYGTKEDITLTVYEREESSEFGRESTLIGFKKYLKGCIEAKRRTDLKKFSVFGLFFLLGVVIMIAVFAIPVVRDNVSVWFAEVLKILANVFIWQFSGFLSFDLPGELRQLRKHHQVLERITFEFKHFE